MIAVALLAPATASAATIWATPDHNTAGGPDRNQADFWGDNCTKLPEGNLGSTFVLDHDYDLVIVKAGSDQSVPDGPNTVFVNPKAGETVWADSNADGVFDQGDKGISHIIVCGPGDEETSTPTATPTDTPTATPTDTPTATPTDTPTATPTDTPTATPTGTTEPTETPNDTPTATPTECPDCSPGGHSGGGTPTPSTQVEGISGTPPAVTPPPTDTIASTTAPSSDGWRLALVGLAGVIALTLIIPKPKRATAKRR
jgi:hypothetical protein